MTLRDVQERLKGRIDIESVDHFESYVLHCGEKGAVTVSLKNGDVVKVLVDGKCKNDILAMLKG